MKTVKIWDLSKKRNDGKAHGEMIRVDFGYCQGAEKYKYMTWEVVTAADGRQVGCWV